MKKQKVQRDRNRSIGFSPEMSILEKNGHKSKTWILKQRSLGELKLGFFSDAGFRNPGSE
jgi:hypothetical protein